MRKQIGNNWNGKVPADVRCEEALSSLLEGQQKEASGQRLALLKKELSSEKKLLRSVVWPVLQSFEGISLEFEIIIENGVRLYIDAVYHPLRFALECEGYMFHAENITRERFDLEKKKVRAMQMQGYRYIPFTRDDLDKRPEQCRQYLATLIRQFSSCDDDAYFRLSVYEREMIRYAIRLNRPFKVADVCYCLQIGKTAGYQVIRKMMNNRLCVAVGTGVHRFHEFVLTPNAVNFAI